MYSPHIVQQVTFSNNKDFFFKNTKNLPLKPSYVVSLVVVHWYDKKTKLVVLRHVREVHRCQGDLSLVMRKPAFCICENKDAYQLRSNCAANQRLCFRYMDNTIPLLSKSEISSSIHLCGSTAWFVLDLFGNPEDRFSHSEAHLLICTFMSSSKIKKSARCCLLE